MWAVTGEGREPVEYAIKLPGQSDGEFVFLPVDSKFPYTTYSDLQNAYEANDFDAVKQKKEQLKNKIKSMARDINTKYICPPKSTNFAIMFLPIEHLQRDHRRPDHHERAAQQPANGLQDAGNPKEIGRSVENFGSSAH